LRAMLKRQLKNLAKRTLRKVFETGQHLGLDILPRHFYSSIPDLRALRRDDWWTRPRSMAGVRGTDPDEQIAFVRQLCQPWSARLPQMQVYAQAQGAAGPGFGRVEAEVLFCLVAQKRPARIVQVGAGVSTAVVLAAVGAVREAGEAAYRPRVTCIDPFPSPYLQSMAQQSRITLIEQGAERVPLETLTDLGPGDLLFVDSTHAVRPGSEVNRIVFEVLPRLERGCLVHFHDVLFPYDYSPWILRDALFFGGETELLLAFLSCNERYAIRASLSMLHYLRPNALHEVLASYRPSPTPAHEGLRSADDPGEFCSSLYLEVIA
jgi:Methyltransferase domain